MVEKGYEREREEAVDFSRIQIRLNRVVGKKDYKGGDDEFVRREERGKFTKSDCFCWVYG